jgi:DNA-binding NarL/FixJ family response regulator
MATIVLLDSQHLFLEAFQFALARHPALSVVGAATHVRQAYELVTTFKPDLVVSDLIVEGGDAVSFARELRRRELSTGLVALTMHARPMFVEDAAAAGIRGYMLKSQSFTEVVAAIERLANEPHFQYFAPSLAQMVPTPGDKAGPSASAGILGRLSPREQEVFYRIIAGDSGRQISRALCISMKTVETHRTHINRKLGVHSPGELIRVAAVAGLLAESHLAHPRAIAASLPPSLSLVG